MCAGHFDGRITRASVARGCAGCPAEVPGKLLINPVQRLLSRTRSAGGQEGNNYPSRGEQVPCPPATSPQLQGIFLPARLCPVVSAQLMDWVGHLLVDSGIEVTLDSRSILLAEIISFHPFASILCFRF